MDVVATDPRELRVSDAEREHVGALLQRGKDMAARPPI